MPDAEGRTLTSTEGTSMSGDRHDGRYMERTVQATTPTVQEDEDGRLSYSTSTGDAVELREACYEPGCQREHEQHADERLHVDV